MPVNVIPFQMPEPMEIPAHIVERLRQLPVAEAMRESMELLLQVEVADVMIHERVDADGCLQLAQVMVREGAADAWQTALAAESFYGAPLSAETSGLAGRALAGGQALLVMGQAAEGEATVLPAGLTGQLIEAGEGSVGFLYVLPLVDGDRPLGALTLVRAPAEGPLNHDQPNITEAMRRLMGDLLAGA